jgi:hypothetical protein
MADNELSMLIDILKGMTILDIITIIALLWTNVMLTMVLIMRRRRGE